MSFAPQAHYPYLLPSPPHPVIFHTPKTTSHRYDPHESDFTPDIPLYPRPQHWRPSFPNKLVPFPNFFARFGSIRVAPLLRYSSKTLPPIRYDLRYHLPSDPRFSLPASHRIPSNDDLQQPITTPALSCLLLWHRRLPWYIDINSSHPHRGVTVADVLSQLSAVLTQPVYIPEYWTIALPKEDRDRIRDSCRTRQTLLAPGVHTGSSVCRVDYLRQDVIFAGLSPSADGTFEIRTIPFM
ncbi:hypothetical protein AGABI1DRAFT_132850 [Agaricus bisporus var. burnettii JB137-S8]|uniref:DUF6699 domain-containing protein n=1 Tax=Agaricus bisporus var. burnettii (strain JB137-S8 / ATCC MYA-4627 / FGSC 10392) TaxID=597362 RepID=K5WVJ4_AGABU|nr:uncharacterized protein AGABI1DRAFT_132850 [Agaricus bisporus var. burnettii JB137-S8]EKM74808.1 hypothetical protein AGABI1DRAFT_132850 [Agaricus bisporus var. burnettii JB137-S8]